MLRQSPPADVADGATPAPAHHLPSRENVEIGALLVASALLRVGVVGAGVAVVFDITDLASGHPSNVAIGFVGAAQAVPEMLFAFFMARFADRFGRARFLVGGPLLGVVGILLVAASTEAPEFAGARILEGIGAAAFVPTALGAIAAETATSTRARARASGAFEGATLAGYAGGFVVGPFTYHALHRGAFPVLAIFYLVAALVCLRFVPRVPPLPTSPVGVVVRTIVGRGPIRTFIPAWLAVNGLVGAWYVNLTALLKRSPDPTQTLVAGFDERSIGLFLLAWVVLLLVGIVLWTPYLRTHGGATTMRRAVPGGYVACAAFLLMNHVPLHWVPAVVPLMGLGVVVQAGFGPAAVAYLADCSERLAADRSTLMAFYTVTLAGGGALGAVLGGLFAKWLLVDGLVLLGVLLLTTALLSLNAVIRYEREHGPPHGRSGDLAAAPGV